MVWMIYPPPSQKRKKKSVKKLRAQHGNHYSWGSNYHLCSVLFSLAGWQHCTVWIPHCALGEDVLPSQEHTPTWTLPGEHIDVFLLAGTKAPRAHLATCNLWHIQLTSGTSHLLLMAWGCFTWLAAQAKTGLQIHCCRKKWNCRYPEIQSGTTMPHWNRRNRSYYHVLSMDYFQSSLEIRSWGRCVCPGALSWMKS